jgi:hypothetical protein
MLCHGTTSSTADLHGACCASHPVQQGLLSKSDEFLRRTRTVLWCDVCIHRPIALPDFVVGHSFLLGHGYTMVFGMLTDHFLIHIISVTPTQKLFKDQKSPFTIYCFY